MEPAAYAEHRGVTRQAVHKAIAEGRIALVRGRIDRDAADQSWAATTTPPPDAPENGAEGALTFNRARTLSQMYRARILQLEFEEMAGRKLDAARVRELAFAQGKAVQDELLSQPARVAHLGAMKSRAELERIIAADNREILERLARAAAGEPETNGRKA